MGGYLTRRFVSRRVHTSHQKNHGDHRRLHRVQDANPEADRLFGPAVVWRHYSLNPLDPSTPITLYAERKGREYKGPAYMTSGAEVFAQAPQTFAQS
jgi:hypothetical protein